MHLFRVIITICLDELITFMWMSLNAKPTYILNALKQLWTKDHRTSMLATINHCMGCNNKQNTYRILISRAQTRQNGTIQTRKSTACLMFREYKKIPRWTESNQRQLLNYRLLNWDSLNCTQTGVRSNTLTYKQCMVTYTWHFCKRWSLSIIIYFPLL